MGSEAPTFEVFFDGDCPLCQKEINMIRKLDRHQRIIFTDIASPTFDSFHHTGKEFHELMDEIHGRHEDGTLVTGVEVFRQLYSRTLFKFLVPPTRIWGIRQGLDLLYTFFAKNRLKFTGRCKDKGCDLKAGMPS